MYRRLARAVLLFLIVLLIPLQTSFGICPAKDPALLILPFQMKGAAPDSPTLVVPVLLREYLSLMKGIAILPIPPENDRVVYDPKTAIKKGREVGAGHLITGRLTRTEASYHLEGFLTSPEGQEISRFEGNFEFPATLNDLLLAWVGELSQALGKRLPPKKILPFLNTTRSAEAYFSWAKGRVELDGTKNSRTPEAVQRAARFFKEAIQKDYNYVPAYLGLAEVLAAQASLERARPDGAAKGASYARQARLELEKAKLLNPPLAKIRTPLIEHSLKGGGTPCPD